MGAPSRVAKGHNPFADELRAAKAKRIESAWNDTDLRVRDIASAFGVEWDYVHACVKRGIAEGRITRPLTMRRKGGTPRPTLTQVIANVRGG